MELHNYSSSIPSRSILGIQKDGTGTFVPARRFINRPLSQFDMTYSAEWNASPDARISFFAIANNNRTAEPAAMSETRRDKHLIDALTLVAVVLMGIGLIVSVTIGVSVLGATFPVGAILLFIAYHMNRIGRHSREPHAQ